MLMRNVRDRILTAFQDASYPGDDNIVPGPGRDPECDQVAEALKAREWKDVGLDLVRDLKEALPLLTPSAFRYYLPAYLLASLEAPEVVDVAVNGVIFNLTPPDDRAGWQWERFNTRARQFTAPEREAIRMFLEFMAEREREDWATAGMEPPDDRLREASTFWAEPRGTV